MLRQTRTAGFAHQEATARSAPQPTRPSARAAWWATNWKTTREAMSAPASTAGTLGNQRAELGAACLAELSSGMQAGRISSVDLLG
ncbi:MAG: hypothetical protein IPH26_22945 [Sterolibacteriaceae bacterium]|uniref:Uncharacterized protein n=1 Tax=Candidatus Methylophosphatis roskildensis TaxID=2899263 RepID=A0A9D7E7L6_9PROT|nr:hypothetical protein [Candidatus Methylophosphatis roskildensis]